MSGRPTYNPVFEEDETIIRDRIIARIPDTWRKDPGDFTYDTVAATPLEVKKLQANQDTILKNGFALYAAGRFLDLKLSEIGLTRIPAVASKRTITVNADAGVVVPLGYKVSTVILDGGGNPVEFTVDAAVTFTTAGGKTVSLTCVTAGDIGNVPIGSQFMLLPPIPGIRVITDGVITVPGADTESDAAAWKRYDFKVTHPDTGGNRNDYIRWVNPIEGVGNLKVISRWNGNGTVKIILAGDDYLPATQSVVDNVQEFLDPLLNVTAEAENMTLSGYGAAIDNSLSYDSGSSVKMQYSASGAGIVKYGFGGTLESLIETENMFKASVMLAVDSVAPTTGLLQITVRDRGTLATLKTTKNGTIDAAVTVKASEFSAISTLQAKSVDFYWDGLQPIEIVITRLTTNTTTTLWVDRIIFTSKYGQGLGHGQAPGGARVTVKAADALAINIAATVTYSSGADRATTKASFEAAVNTYLQTIIFKDGYDVVHARIGSLLINTEGVSNYTNLTINGGTLDIPIGAEELPVVGTVAI